MALGFRVPRAVLYCTLQYIASYLYIKHPLSKKCLRSCYIARTLLSCHIGMAGQLRPQSRRTPTCPPGADFGSCYWEAVREGSPLLSKNTARLDALRHREAVAIPGRRHVLPHSQYPTPSCSACR